MTKNQIILIVIAVVVLGGIVVWYMMTNTIPANYMPYSSNTANNNGTTSNGTTAQGTGTMYVTVTDAASDMENVTAITMTIDKVDAYSNTQGWILLSQTPQTFNLLDLKAKSRAELLAKVNVPPDNYNQIRFHVTKILVTAAGQVREAKLPSQELKINANVLVNGNTNSVAMLDVMADKSLHKTAKGEYIFTPVVKFDSSSDAAVSVDAKNTVIVSGGKVHDSVNVGMDVDGTVKANFQIDPKIKFNINGGLIQGY